MIPSALNESKDNDLLTTADINDDGNTSDSSASAQHEVICDDGPVPLACERGQGTTHSPRRREVNSTCFSLLEFSTKSQGIALLQVYDRSMSQNSCARTDIALRRGSRARRKAQPPASSNHNEEKPEIPSHPPLPATPSATAMMMAMKQEDRNLSVRDQMNFAAIFQRGNFLRFALCFRNFHSHWIKGHR